MPRWRALAAALLVLLLAGSRRDAAARGARLTPPPVPPPPVPRPDSPAWYVSLYNLRAPLPASHLAVGGGWGAPRPGGRAHEGIDYAAPTGTPVSASADGIVMRVRYRTVNAAGKYVAIRHAGGVVTRYLHLDTVAAGIAEGVSVVAGQLLGTVGATGTQSGFPHLHYDVKVPRALLPELEALGLKPTTGWGAYQAGVGVGVPAEPWAPALRYRSTTRANAARNRIPLWADRS